MKKLTIHNPLFRVLIPPLIGLFSYLVILLFYNDLTSLVSFFTSQELYLVIFLAYLVFETGRGIVLLVEKFSPFDRYASLSIAILILAGAITTYLITDFILLLYFRELIGFSASTNLVRVFHSIFISISLMYQLFYLGLFFLYRKHESRLMEEKALNQDLEESMVRFKNEINPSMLYESLESLILLSRKNPEEADEFINNLSGIYRYILSNKQSELVDLDTEVKVSEDMVKLLNYKWLNAISFDFDKSLVDNGLQLIPGTLPKLVEAIVENNIISPEFPLFIHCEYESDSNYIVLRYPLNERLTTNEDRVVKEIQHSYSFLSDKPLVHVKAFGEGYIKIPVLNNHPVEAL